MTVYADNAATTRMSRTALDAMLPAMEENYGNPSSLHSVGRRTDPDPPGQRPGGGAADEEPRDRGPVPELPAP